MNIYLIGYMYSGKTTFGRRLASQRGMAFVDLDHAFEERYHYTVRDCFARFGESAFRRLETEVLHSTATLHSAVIATGGGTPCYGDNMDFILAHGTAVYLQMTVDQLVQRALDSRNPRPAMRGLSADEVRRRIERQLREREPYYRRASIVVDGAMPDLDLL